MSLPTIAVDGLWKKFGLTINEAIRYGLLDLTKKLSGRGQDRSVLRPGEFWALQDVGFDLLPGEAIGILGVNGSGKTTLLRILNGAFLPDRGLVEIRGRVGALIAAGAGFAPLLTGRENVYVNGSLLGMSKQELDRQFDEIVYLSGLDKFIDMPVKNYSSGMTVRLGFAVAIMGDPDLLLIDEVLAVGDVSFQKLCYERILGKIRSGTSVIFISHSISAVWAICDKGIFLDKGVSCGVESVEDACRRYELANHHQFAENSAPFSANDENVSSSQRARILGMRSCQLSTGVETCEYEFQEPILLIMEFDLADHIQDLIIRVAFDASHYKFICVSDSSYSEGSGMVSLQKGRYEARIVINSPPFRPGAYVVHCAVCSKGIGVHLDALQRAVSFVIRPAKHIFLYDADSPAVIYTEAQHTIEKITS